MLSRRRLNWAAAWAASRPVAGGAARPSSCWNPAACGQSGEWVGACRLKVEVLGAPAAHLLPQLVQGCRRAAMFLTVDFRHGEADGAVCRVAAGTIDEC